MIAIVQEIIDETPDTKTFRLAFEDKEYAKSFEWEPGQFVEVTVFGAGEAPIGFASDPNERSFFELTVVERGKVTRAMHALKKGEKVGIRGPFGNCWPLEDMKGKDVLIVSGGCGLAPLRPAILQILANRKEYGNFLLLYGARTPADRNYKYDLDAWAKRDDMQVLETVDVGDENWKGNVGVVTTLFDKMKVDGENTVALTCGPPIMIKFVTLELLKMGFSEDRIVTSQERYMKCGVGKCGHCCINHVYLCTEGPVFTYAQMKELFELKL
ncbi:MAG: FAD/NAD(P)-binding protein [Armatimonadetes bacterium]|nr:FAD/NAD(P)-binding protein [Armatimonadota bacterium]